jgi:preprotein translocase subunit SecE
MARQTRAQRRARRAEAMRQGGQTERARATHTPAPAAARSERGARDGGIELHVPGGGFRRFVGESWAELKKVEWPNQNQLIQGVVVVLIACLIVGIYLWGADLVFKRLVQDFLI